MWLTALPKGRTGEALLGRLIGGDRVPKSKKRKKSAAGAALARDMQWGGGGTKKTRLFDRVILPIVAVVVVVGGGLWWWQTSSAKRAFAALADDGAAILDQVQESRSDGRRHLNPGERHVYASRYPTSGPHEPIWTRPGFYESRQPPTRLVHALEHGNIVIYYDRPDGATLATLRDWADLFTGQWDGMVVTKDSGLGAGLVLTAWTKRLDLDSFDAAQAAAFVDAYRGRGPENPVR